MTTKKTPKKTTKKKTAKKAPPHPSKLPASGTAALEKRLKALETKVKKLEKELVELRDAEPDGPETEVQAPEAEAPSDSENGSESLNDRVTELHDLVYGPMTTKIRQTESRIETCETTVEAHEERLNDIETLIIEGDEDNEQAAGT